jgi:YVTN family beta-propeller protein
MRPDGNKLYVTNSYDNSLSVTATDSNTVTKVPVVGQNPVGVAVTPDGSKVYVANQLSPDTVSVINARTNAFVATVTVGQNPIGVAVTPDGKNVYVTNEGNNTVSVIATDTKTIVATVLIPLREVVLWTRRL